MNEQSYREVKRREIRRFHAAVDSVVDNLLLKKYDETRNAEEYRDYSRICGLVKSNLHTLDLMADQMGVLFERTSERSNWEIYLTGLRKTARKLPDSYLFRFVLPMLGLETLREKLSAYSIRCLDQFHTAHKTLQETDRYLQNLTRGYGIAQEYHSDHTDLPRLYSSVKTWESNQDLGRFLGQIQDLLDLTVEVFIAGPIQLYLMIGRDTFLAVFKALTVGKLNDLQQGDREQFEMLQLHDFLHNSAASSKTLEITQEILREAVKEYTKRFREEHEALRGQLPTQEIRRRFIHRYESGILFQSQPD
ncbi:MAG: hypothetical protein M1358_17095 [Chloroflexi bacterium]|nr:hypothetical protein [Chloroflexota bacterium]